MVVTLEPILNQLNNLIERYEQAEASRQTVRTLKNFLTSAQAAIERLAPPGSAYLVNSRILLGNIYSDEGSLLAGLMGVVEALRNDYESGALTPIQELIRAEVFDDFLEMAQHLLESGYKDPAAVLVGGVLEDELRKLAGRTSVPTNGPDGRPTKSETINAALASKGIYNKLDQKSVTSWLDLRNKAAHGQYGEYTGDQVTVMLMGVRSFVSRMSSGAA